MGWKILGYLLTFILAVSILINIWNAIGMWLIWGPLILIGILALVRVTAALIGQGHARRQQRIVAAAGAARGLKQRTAASEAALGIAIPSDDTQPCPVCERPRVVGARYCAECGYDWEYTPPPAHALVCLNCNQRIPDDARRCPFCGCVIPASLRRWNSSTARAPTPIAKSQFRCQLCGTELTIQQGKRRPRRCLTCGASFAWPTSGTRERDAASDAAAFPAPIHEHKRPTIIVTANPRPDPTVPLQTPVRIHTMGSVRLASCPSCDHSVHDAQMVCLRCHTPLQWPDRADHGRDALHDHRRSTRFT